MVGNKYRVRLSKNSDHSVGKWIEARWDGRFFQRAMVGYSAQYRVDEISQFENISQLLVASFEDSLRYMSEHQLASLQRALNEERRKREENYSGRHYEG